MLTRYLLFCGMVAAGVTQAQTLDPGAGARLYRLHCSECHGLDGQGGQGADLTRGVFRFGSSDEALYRTISKGLAGTPMPATALSEAQLVEVVRHVRLLAGGTRITVPGNTAAGEALFTGKGGCTKCHMVRGVGGRLGPDLTMIGSQRSPSHLRASILRPDEEVTWAYWSVEAVDNKGKAYSGIRIGEDTYSVQLLDLNEELRSLAKEDLKKLVVDRKSRMPGYGQVFTSSELDDLVAYLYGLERKARRP